MGLEQCQARASQLLLIEKLEIRIDFTPAGRFVRSHWSARKKFEQQYKKKKLLKAFLAEVCYVNMQYKLIQLFLWINFSEISLTNRWKSSNTWVPERVCESQELANDEKKNSFKLIFS